MAAQPAHSDQSARNRTANRTQSGSYSKIWFAATTLLGAFLVFQVQPVISKCVLPWFGGTPAVWTTCMLFFQLLLFGWLSVRAPASHLVSTSDAGRCAPVAAECGSTGVAD